MTFATQAPGEKSAAADVDVEGTNGVDGHSKELGQELPFDGTETHVQSGVKGIEAVTSVWSKKTLWIMMALLYLVSFSDMLLVAIQTNLNPYITSEFQQHSLLPVVNIIATVLGGTCQLAIAKIVDIWGRATGFLFLLLLNVIGNIVKATCKDVVSYTAGHTIYWVGHIGLLYVVDILLADMTTLKNRMIIFGINGTPTIATTFAGPAIAELFYTEANFRWAFGAFTIILVGICAPVTVVLLWHQRKAERLGLMEKTASGRTWYQSTKHYLIEIDVVGIVLITAGWSLLLLPFSLATESGQGWASASMIVMLVVGFVCLVAFVAWERWFAPVQFFPFRYLKERTIIGACLLYGIMFISVFAWDTYYTSYLQVVHDLTITTGGYVLNAFSLVSAFIAPLVGVLMRYTGDYKYTSYACIPILAIGTGLLAKFRTPESHVGLLVMCQVLNGIATGVFAQCSQLAIFSVVTHQEIAVALALWGLFGSIGAAIGNAIAGAIWTNILPGELLKALPEDQQDLMPEIYGSLTVQQDYPIGDPIRDAIISAYDVAQHKMVIAGAAFVPVLVFCVFMFRTINVKKLEAARGAQTKGEVF